MNNEEYQELVYKLAGEIVDEAGMEVEAGFHPVKGLKDIPYHLRNVKGAMKAGNKAAAKHQGKMAVRKSLPAGAAVASGVGATIAAMRHKKKASENEDYGFDKQAAEEAYIGSVIEKAASVYEEAQSKIAAAMEVLAEAELEENAAMEVMAQLGLFED